MTAIEDVNVAQAIRPFLAQAAEHLGAHETARFETGGGEICAIVAPGSQPPVLFLHGNSSSKHVWRHQLSYLRGLGRAFLAVDLPGHGEARNSCTPQTTYSFPGYARVIQEVLDRLHCTAVDVVGWSLGGHIGLELLATDDRIRSLMIIGTPPARPCADVVERVFHDCAALAFASKRDLSDGEALAYGAAMMGGREYLTPELLMAIRRTDGRARVCMFENALRGIGTDQQATVETIAKPLCVVHGACEPFVRLDWLRSLKYRALWQDCIHVVPGAGHAPQWQCPVTFNKIMRSFLQSIDASAPCADTPELPSLVLGA